jgi:hypothetical protein
MKLRDPSKMMAYRKYVCVGVPLLDGAAHWLAKPNPNTIH